MQAANQSLFAKFATMHRICNAWSNDVKTATIPSLRVEPELREAAEGVLQEGESLSSFVEQSIRTNIERRRVQKEFIARGLASRDESKRTGQYVSAEEVLRMLDLKLEKARAKPVKSKGII
jgi:predicted transcriptional regulator